MTPFSRIRHEYLQLLNVITTANTTKITHLRIDAQCNRASGYDSTLDSLLACPNLVHLTISEWAPGYFSRIWAHEMPSLREFHLTRCSPDIEDVEQLTIACEDGGYLSRIKKLVWLDTDSFLEDAWRDALADEFDGNLLQESLTEILRAHCERWRVGEEYKSAAKLDYIDFEDIDDGPLYNAAVEVVRAVKWERLVVSIKRLRAVCLSRGVDTGSSYNSILRAGWPAALSASSHLIEGASVAFVTAYAYSVPRFHTATTGSRGLAVAS